MSVVLVRFDEPIFDPAGSRYYAQAVGRQREDGLWEGCLEFLPADIRRETLRSGRETTQPNRKTLEYWSQGLTRVYLTGALGRALKSTPSIDREREAFDARRRGS
jgi:hypothetical protein